jgi:CubicO group peptidase (beta-lactamase class C family)
VSGAADGLFDLVAAVADDARRQAGVAGVAVGMLVDGTPHARGLGVTRAETDVPVTSGTLFRLCSVTKPFTATLAMALVARGELALDEPVARVLPHLRLTDEDLATSVTLRHLLTHTGGFEGELPVDDLGLYGDDDGALERAVADYHRLRRWVAPGEAFGYCNAGYWLTGACIAGASGLVFEDAMRAFVLESLGLERTRMSIDDAARVDVAWPHVRPAPGAPAKASEDDLPFPRARVASGGVVSCIDDLLTFAAFHLGSGPTHADVLPRGARLAMQRDAVRWGLADGQGIGWSVRHHPGGLIVWHDGGYPGYASLLALFPSEGAAIAVLVNDDEGARVWKPVLSAAVEELLGPDAPPAEGSVPESALRRFEGRYELEEGQEARVGVVGEQLEVLVRRPEPRPRVRVLRLRAVTEAHHSIVEGSDDDEIEEVGFVSGPGGEVRAIRIGKRLGRRV